MKKISVILFLIFIAFSCGKNDKANQNNTKIETKEDLENAKERYFYNKSIDKIIENFEEISKKNKITIEKFEKLDFENKNFFTSKIVMKQDSNYVVEYSGIEVTGLFVNVEMEETGTDLGMVETIVVNLIEISDTEIKEEEARKLYTEILATMKQDELTNTVMYENNIKYGIQISEETGRVTFFIQP